MLFLHWMLLSANCYPLQEGFRRSCCFVRVALCTCQSERLLRSAAGVGAFPFWSDELLPNTYYSLWPDQIMLLNTFSLALQFLTCTRRQNWIKQGWQPLLPSMYVLALRSSSNRCSPTDLKAYETGLVWTL
jgi:hypothetical protein